MKTTGRHLLVEYRGCDPVLLNDQAYVERLMRRAAEVAGATIVASVFRDFTPQGVTGVVVVEESHLSIHTWPEYGYAAVDFYTCGDCSPDAAHRLLNEELQAREAEVMAVARGEQSPQSIRVVEHRRERPVSGPIPATAGER